MINVVVQRLFTDAVASEDQRSSGLIPQSKGEHSAKTFHKAVWERFVQVHNRFCVALRPKRVAMLQTFFQFFVVVDFAVEADPNGSVFVRKRLLSGAQVDDAETAMAESNATPQMDAALVGPSVMHDIGHFPDQPLVNGSAVEVEET